MNINNQKNQSLPNTDLDRLGKTARYVGIGFGSYDHTTEHLLTKSWKRLQPPDLAMCGKVNVAL